MEKQLGLGRPLSRKPQRTSTIWRDVDSLRRVQQGQRTQESLRESHPPCHMEAAWKLRDWQTAATSRGGAQEIICSICSSFLPANIRKASGLSQAVWIGTCRWDDAGQVWHTGARVEWTPKSHFSADRCQHTECFFDWQFNNLQSQGPSSFAIVDEASQVWQLNNLVLVLIGIFHCTLMFVCVYCFCVLLRQHLPGHTRKCKYYLLCYVEAKDTLVSTKASATSPSQPWTRSEMMRRESLAWNCTICKILDFVRKSNTSRQPASSLYWAEKRSFWTGCSNVKQVPCFHMWTESSSTLSKWQKRTNSTWSSGST